MRSRSSSLEALDQLLLLRAGEGRERWRRSRPPGAAGARSRPGRRHPARAPPAGLPCAADRRRPRHPERDRPAFLRAIVDPGGSPAGCAAQLVEALEERRGQGHVLGRGSPKASPVSSWRRATSADQPASTASSRRRLCAASLIGGSAVDDLGEQVQQAGHQRRPRGVAPPGQHRAELAPVGTLPAHRLPKAARPSASPARICWRIAWASIRRSSSASCSGSVVGGAPLARARRLALGRRQAQLHERHQTRLDRRERGGSAARSSDQAASLTTRRRSFARCRRWSPAATSSWIASTSCSQTSSRKACGVGLGRQPSEAGGAVDSRARAARGSAPPAGRRATPRAFSPP